MFVLKVLDVVRSNYDSLTLKMQDSLDQYERYSEKPKDIASFFTHMVSKDGNDLINRNDPIINKPRSIMMVLSTCEPNAFHVK